MDKTFILNLVVMLSVTVVTILVLGYVLKLLKRVSVPMSKNVEVIGGANLGGKSKLYLLKVDDKQILIGATDNNINTLHVYEKMEKAS